MANCQNVRGRRSAIPARKRGFVLVAFSLSLIFLLGMVGLAVDLGRMYVVKNESQSFCDSAAMFAAKELDGTAAGVTAALNKVSWVTQDPNGPRKGFEFGLREFQSITTTFATAWNGPNWVDAAAAASDPTNYYFVRVETHNPVNLWFLPGLVSSTVSNVGASAVAGRAVESQMVQGLAPFAPFQLPQLNTICTAAELQGCSLDPNNKYGMVKGEWYTIRWLAGQLQPTEIQNFCPGDRCPCMLKLANLSAASAGYAMYQGASEIREAIVGTPPLSTPLTEGSILDLQNGQVHTEMRALEDRILQDSDTTSNFYQAGADPVYYPYPGQSATTAYAGTGRRIIVTPIQSAQGAVDGDPKSNTVVGFSAFFLGPSGSYWPSQPSKVGACGQYLGEFTIGAPGSGGSGPGGNNVYTLRLYR